MSGLAEQRWRALRALSENHGAPHGLLAQASGLMEASITATARREGWIVKAGRNRLFEDLLERLMRDAHAIAEAGADVSQKGQIDAIGALLRTVEKLHGLTAAVEEPQQQTKERDDKIAAILGRIDTQIHQLAHAYAGDIAKGKKAGGEKAGKAKRRSAKGASGKSRLGGKTD